MALVNSAFTVNVTPGAMPPTVHVSEYDIGRTYTVTINGENGSVFNIPTGTTATVEGTLNGVIGFNTDATISGSTVSFTLTESMTAKSGKAWCKIKLTLNDEPIQTCAFVLAVDRAGVEADTVIGADGFDTIIQNAVDNYLDDHNIVIDPTLSVSGAAADAKVTGEKISYTNNAIDAVADVYDTSENLFNPATFENGKQLTSNGTITDNSTFALSDYVPVKSGWVLNGYIAQNTISGLGGWFDADKVWQGKIEELSGYTLTDRNKRYFTLVCDFDGYIRVNVYANAPYQQTMLKLNTVIDTSLSEPLCQNYHAYEPAYEKASELKVQTSYGKYVRENNGLFDGTKAVSGYLARDGAQVWSNARYKTSDYIPVDPSTEYIIQGITSHFCLYDSTKANIAASFNGTGTNNRAFNSGNAAFVRFTYYATEESRMYIRASYGSFFDTQKGGAYFTDDNPLLGKTLYTIGDSIMAGDGNNGFGIGDIITSRNSMYLKDWSRGGATIGWRESQGDSVYNIQHQATLAAAENTPDYILIDGQTNDIDNASTIPVGEIGASFDSANFVRTTFTGGLETIFSILKSAFPSAKIVYVRVHHIGSRGLDSQEARCEAAQSVCLKWGVPIADLYGKGTLNTFLSQYEQYTNNADKTHPTREGYDLFYIPLIESVLKAIS